MSEKECVTHHHGCDCREAKVKRLVLAARKFLESMNDKREGRLKRALKEWEGEFE